MYAYIHFLAPNAVSVNKQVLSLELLLTKNFTANYRSQLIGNAI